MPRIAEIIRFYSLEDILAFIEEGGEYPLHHIWCFDQLIENGFDVGTIDYDKSSWLNKLGVKFDVFNLQQQINLLFQSANYDVIFAPFISDVFLLSILKNLGLYRKPIVGIAHDSYVHEKKSALGRIRKNILRKIYLGGVDKILFITEGTFKKSCSSKMKSSRHTFLEYWGVDFDFFKSYAERNGNKPTLDFIYTTGGTGRDFETLFEAFRDINFKLKVTTKRKLDVGSEFASNNNIYIDDSITPGLHSVGMIREEYYNSLAVAVPTDNIVNHSPIGSTVILESLAMGKPVIATENKSYGFNLKKEKVGFEVGYGDVGVKKMSS